MPLGIFIKLFRFIQKHWKIFLTIAFLSLAYLAFQRYETGWSSKYEKLEELQTEELQKIDAARKAERVENEKNIKQLTEALAASQALYEEQRANLEVKKTKRIKQIIDESSDDPVELAKALSNVTGFKVRGQ